jgi:hypothetical protein
MGKHPRFEGYVVQFHYTTPFHTVSLDKLFQLDDRLLFFFLCLNFNPNFIFC